MNLINLLLLWVPTRAQRVIRLRPREGRKKIVCGKLFMFGFIALPEDSVSLWSSRTQFPNGFLQSRCLPATRTSLDSLPTSCSEPFAVLAFQKLSCSTSTPRWTTSHNCSQAKSWLKQILILFLETTSNWYYTKQRKPISCTILNIGGNHIEHRKLFHKFL